MNPFLSQVWECFVAGAVYLWAEQRDFLLVFLWLAAAGLLFAWALGSGPLAAGAGMILFVLAAVCFLTGMRQGDGP